MPIIKFHVVTNIAPPIASVMQDNIQLVDIYVFQQTQFNKSCDVNVGVIPGGIKPDGTLKWKRVVNTTMLAFNPDIGLTGDNIYHSVVTGSSYNRVSSNINDYALFENSFVAKNGAKAFHWGAVRVRTCKDIYINHPEETTFTRGVDSTDFIYRYWVVRIRIKDNFGDFMPSDRLNSMWVHEVVDAPWDPHTGDDHFNGSQNWLPDTHGGNLKGWEGSQGTQTLSFDHVSRTHTISFTDIDRVDGLEFLDIKNK